MLYTSGNREIKTDAETGATYWVARLDKLMFTWFKVPPHTIFPMHAHESEQITYILEGVLFFEMDEQVHRLEAGDCISIPSNKQHKVWTASAGAKAIDAWSPVNTQYQ